jgi:hypothetical protein
MSVDYISIITIMVSIMAACAVFITVTPVIDRLRDRRLKKIENKMKNLIRQIEVHEKEIQIQKIELNDIRKTYLYQFEKNEVDNKK